MEDKELLLIIPGIFVFLFGLKKLIYTEKRSWERAQKKDTINAYTKFISRFHFSSYCEEARARVEVIETERQTIQDAVHKILPMNTHGQVEFDEGWSGSNLCISAHLLNAYSPEDRDPLVKGAYGSHAALYQYVKKRIAEIYKTAFNSAKTLRLENVVVNCNHGVHHIVIGGPGSGDYAETLYTTVINGKKAKEIDWTNVGDETIQKVWSVSRDIIPSLEFKFEHYYRHR